MTDTHAVYQHSITLEVGTYPRDLAAVFPQLVELKEGQKPLAFAPATDEHVDAVRQASAKHAADEDALRRAAEAKNTDHTDAKAND